MLSGTYFLTGPGLKYGGKLLRILPGLWRGRVKHQVHQRGSREFRKGLGYKSFFRMVCHRRFLRNSDRPFLCTFRSSSRFSKAFPAGRGQKGEECARVPLIARLRPLLNRNGSAPRRQGLYAKAVTTIRDALGGCRHYCPAIRLNEQSQGGNSGDSRNRLYLYPHL